MYAQRFADLFRSHVSIYQSPVTVSLPAQQARLHPAWPRYPIPQIHRREQFGASLSRFRANGKFVILRGELGRGANISQVTQIQAPRIVELCWRSCKMTSTRLGSAVCLGTL